MKRLCILLLCALCLSACQKNESSFVSGVYNPVISDENRVYSGQPANHIVSASFDTGLFGPLCWDPLCLHQEESCSANIGTTISAITRDGEGNIIAAARSSANPSARNILRINTETGERNYVLKEYENNITAMMVIGDSLYFLSQLEGNADTGNHSVCYVPLSGGKVTILKLPENDYYFAGADGSHLYLQGFLDRTLSAVDYRNGHTFRTLHTFDHTQATDCYIDGNMLYFFTSRESAEVTASHENFPYFYWIELTRQMESCLIASFMIQSRSCSF